MPIVARDFPPIGIGTFGSDRYTPAEVGAAVASALRLGYRLVDCAAVYGNEAEVGAALEATVAELGLARDRYRVMTKVWNDAHAPADAVASVHRSLRDLRLESLDVVFVHWPFPNHHAAGVSVDSRDPHAKPYDHQGFMALWAALEGLVDEGIVAALGVSNVSIAKLRPILRDARIAPRFLELELHPTLQQGELFQFAVEHDIQPVGYSPLGSPSRPERDRTPDDLVDLEAPEVVAIAEARGLHPAQVCLKWAVERGQIPIPFSVKPAQQAANLEALAGPRLTPRERDALAAVERNNRLIKGQVFLWPSADSWVDLWDVDGVIAGQDGR